MTASKYEDKTDQTKVLIQTIMGLMNVNLTFELDCELEEYKAQTSMIIWVDRLEFNVMVTKDHITGEVKPSVNFYNIAGGSFSMYIFNFPDNAYTQLIGKEVKP